MNKELVIVLAYLTEFVMFLTNGFVGEVVLVETNQRIKDPELVL